MKPQVQLVKKGRDVHLIMTCNSPTIARAFFEDLLSQIKRGKLELNFAPNPTILQTPIIKEPKH